MRRMNWTQQIVTIENKGFAAFHAGTPRTANPYPAGGGSVGRQRRLAWLRGWELAEREKSEREKSEKL